LILCTHKEYAACNKKKGDQLDWPHLAWEVPPENTLHGRKNKKGWENEEKLVSNLLDDLRTKKILELERGSSRSHSVKYSIWKRLRTCRKTT
jgi:hypothetical protein